MKYLEFMKYEMSYIVSHVSFAIKLHSREVLLLMVLWFIFFKTCSFPRLVLKPRVFYLIRNILLGENEVSLLIGVLINNLCSQGCQDWIILKSLAQTFSRKLSC